MTTSIMRTYIASLAVAGAALYGAAPAAAADDVYNNSARIGLYAVFYHSTADDISGPYVPPGVNLDAKDAQTVYFGYVRRLSEHFQAELALGYPPLTKTVGKGPAYLGSVPYDGQVISTARWIAPTVLVEYMFFDDSAKLRPYLGVGVNYTTFTIGIRPRRATPRAAVPPSSRSPRRWGLPGPWAWRIILPIIGTPMPPIPSRR